jgi:CheY-like chemotaxis protein
MTKQQTEYLGTMQTSGENMMALLNDILDFEKIESGKMEIEEIEFDMTKLVQDVITLMTGHAAEKETQLTSNIAPNFPRSLKGDPTRLRQVLLNLVSNANKFTDKGTVTIHLQAKSLSKDKSAAPADFTDYEIICKVEDTGIGISTEAQETLFTPFTQADKSTSRKYGGTGLGLTICRKLIEAMKGKIKLESEENVGSTFFFTLKMSGRQDIATQDTPKSKAKNDFRIVEPMNILVVEDNEMNRRVLKGFLEKDSHTVTLRDSGESALETCESRMFDIIITDINLGGMDGMEFTRNLRIFPNKKTAATPVIALSGNVSKEDMKAAFDANMNGFLIKPIDPEALSKTLLNAEDGQFEQDVILPSDNASNHITQFVSSPEKPSIQYDKPQLDDINTSEDFDSFAEILDGDAEKDDTQDTPEIERTLENIEHGLKVAEGAEPTTFNPQFLETLAGSLPADQMRDLMLGFSNEAERIIGELEAMINTKDADGIYEKGHELKGMAANFGMTLIADISGTIEKAGKEDRADDAIEDIKKLADANRRAQEELEEWLKTF